jgi:XTP/dITP diphosphohydrolase
MIKIYNNPNNRILLATTNKGKQEELKELLAGLPCRLVTPNQIHLALDVKETGNSYSENAILKAEAYASASGFITLADDTGLEVDALNGAPGLHSARFSPLPGATDADRRKLLLETLARHARPWLARFQCVVAVAAPLTGIQLFDGSVEGEIIDVEKGIHGFGYDRLFWIPQAGKTMAELSMEEKNKLSHRAVAVKKAIPYLEKIIRS